MLTWTMINASVYESNPLQPHGLFASVNTMWNNIHYSYILYIDSDLGCAMIYRSELFGSLDEAKEHAALKLLRLDRIFKEKDGLRGD